MLTVEQLVQNRDVQNLCNFGLVETPVLVDVGGDSLKQIFSIGMRTIQTSAGPHDVLVMTLGHGDSYEV